MSTITPEFATKSGVERRTSRIARPWAVTGVVAAAAAVIGSVAEGTLSAAYDRKTATIASAVRDRVGDQRPAIVVFHVAMMVAVMLIPVFAAGLARRLKVRLPADSLLPTLVLIGMTLVAVSGLVGTGLDTEFLNGPIDKIAPAESVAFYGHWLGTMPMLWGGAGIAALAVFAAARRYRAVPRWIGRVSLVFGGLTAVAAVSPLQYISAMTGVIWLLVVSIGFTFGDRAHADAMYR